MEQPPANNITLFPNNYLLLPYCNNNSYPSPPLCYPDCSKQRLYCPSNLNMNDLLDDAERIYWTPQLWRLYYILTVIYRARFWNKALPKNAFIPLSSTALQESIGTRFAVKARNLLLKLKIIETDNYYIVGGKFRGKCRGKCRGYRFLEPYQSAKFREVKSSSIPPKTIARIKSRPLKEQSNKLEHIFLRNNLAKLTVAPEVKGFFDTFMPSSNRVADYYERSIEMIQNQDWMFNWDPKTGRVFNNLTSLPRLLRPYLRLDNKPLVEIDVGNCQPFLLLGLYDGDEPEKEQYKSIVERGKFYEDLQKGLDAPFNTMARKQFKQEVFRHIFFGRIKTKPNVVYDEFARKYPVLSHKMEDLKRPDHRQCALYLQREEANIVISGVIGKIARMPAPFPALTIHDSILTTGEYITRAMDLFKGEFCSNFGFAPPLDIKGFPPSNASLN